MTFQNQTAIVTGAASNIGRAIALALGRAGARVLATDVSTEKLDALKSEIEGGGGTCSALPCDLAAKDGWKDVVGMAEGHLVRYFVHSACPPRREEHDVAGVDEATFDAMQNVNVRSGFFIARNLGVQLKEAGQPGSQVFITSLHDQTPRNLPHYTSAKHGSTGIMKDLARYFAPFGIRCNAIAPGAFPEGGAPSQFAGGGVNLAAAAGEGLLGRIPMRRFGTGADIAGPTMALLDDSQSAYVTGQTLAVDGGLRHYNWIKLPT